MSALAEEARFIQFLWNMWNWQRLMMLNTKGVNNKIERYNIFISQIFTDQQPTCYQPTMHHGRQRPRLNYWLEAFQRPWRCGAQRTLGRNIPSETLVSHRLKKNNKWCLPPYEKTWGSIYKPLHIRTVLHHWLTVWMVNSLTNGLAPTRSLPPVRMASGCCCSWARSRPPTRRSWQ